MSQCPPNFSYVEVGKAVGFDSLEKRVKPLVRIRRKSLRTLMLELRGLI